MVRHWGKLSAGPRGTGSQRTNAAALVERRAIRLSPWVPGLAALARDTQFVSRPSAARAGIQLFEERFCSAGVSGVCCSVRRHYSAVKERGAIGVNCKQAKENQPLFRLWARGSPSFLFSVSLLSRGMARRQGARPGSPGRRWLGLRPGLGVKRHAPRLAARQRGIFGLRLSQRSGRTRSYLSLAGLSRGRPWVRLA